MELLNRAGEDADDARRILQKLIDGLIELDQATRLVNFNGAGGRPEDSAFLAKCALVVSIVASEINKRRRAQAEQELNEERS
jgi:hypothetical protein